MALQAVERQEFGSGKVVLSHFASGSATRSSNIVVNDIVFGDIDSTPVASRGIDSIMRPALMALVRIANRPVAVEASRLIRRLGVAARVYVASVELPPISAIESDDGSVLVEWIFGGRRIGFAFELNPLESSWYYASSVSRGGESEYGEFRSADIRKLVDRVINDA